MPSRDFAGRCAGGSSSSSSRYSVSSPSSCGSEWPWIDGEHCDELEISWGARMRVSVVCPFYNEAQILESAVRTLLDRLRSLDGSWELIIVNDGSTDGSAEIAQRIAKEESSRLRVLGYPTNRGRGHALRVGIAAARGDIIVTTEIDLSWGEQIVHELVAAMERWPDADIVVASPNLASGGYKNVPLKRVWLSRIGNRVIRA